MGKDKSVRYEDALRKQFKMTPAQIAGEIHATRQSVYNWLAGRSEPLPSFRDALKSLYERKTAEMK